MVGTGVVSSINWGNEVIGAAIPAGLLFVCAVDAVRARLRVRRSDQRLDGWWHRHPDREAWSTAAWTVACRASSYLSIERRKRNR